MDNLTKNNYHQKPKPSTIYTPKKAIIFIMRPPKCLACQSKTELVICYCSEPQKVYFCWTCRKHYPTTN